MINKDTYSKSKIKHSAQLRLLEYVDYRTFLRDVIDLRKKTMTQWSYKVWATHLQLKSPSTLIMIINGTRNPSKKLTERIIAYFGFNEDGAQHFRDLVQLSKVKKDLSAGIEVMQKIDQSSTLRGVRLLDDKSFSAISNWYYYAIREMVNLKNFREDSAWISENLRYKVSSRRITKAIDTLIQLGMLRRNRKGKLMYADGTVDTNNDMASEGLKRFHLQSLENALEAQQTLPSDAREISGSVFAIKQENMINAKKIIRKFHRDMCMIMEEKNSDVVYQLEVAFFPISKPITATLDGVRHDEPH